MKTFKTITIALFASIFINSCVGISGGAFQHDTEVSELNTETTMNSFNGISAGGSMNVVLNQGDKNSVLVKGSDKDILDKIVIYVNDDNLYIETKKKFLEFVGSINLDDITIYVTTPKIESIELAGSGNITANKPINADNVNVKLAGSGDIDISNAFTCNLLDVEVAGSGNVIFEQVTASKVKTSIAGSGNVSYDNMNVVSAISDIAGSGNITLKGKASKHTQNIVGSGNIDTSGLIQ